MTIASNDVAGSVPVEVQTSERDQQIATATQEFETLLLSQLVSVMRSTVSDGGLFGSGTGSDIYAHFFDQSFAEAMSQGGGIGLSSVLAASMRGPSAYRAQMDMAPLPPRSPTPASVGVNPLAVRRPDALGPDIAGGAVGRIRAAAAMMLGPDGNAAQWGRAGRLTGVDLASEFFTDGPEGRAAFNVEDAAGFEGCYKCNLFAFELVRRAGFMVPLIGRPRGWGYMGPDGVVADAADGSMRQGWGRSVTGEAPASLNAGLESGNRAFVLAGTSTGDLAGHMGVIERVHAIDYDDHGSIRRIVYDGWEGRSDGARHLTRRTWNRYGNPGGNDARGGFDRIEIIELRRPQAGGPEERPVHRHARPSVRDLERTFFSSSPSERPNPWSEET